MEKALNSENSVVFDSFEKKEVEVLAFRMALGHRMRLSCMTERFYHPLLVQTLWMVIQVQPSTMHLLYLLARLGNSTETRGKPSRLTKYIPR